METFGADPHCPQCVHAIETLQHALWKFRHWARLVWDGYSYWQYYSTHQFHLLGFSYVPLWSPSVHKTKCPKGNSILLYLCYGQGANSMLSMFCLQKIRELSCFETTTNCTQEMILPCSCIVGASKHYGTSTIERSTGGLTIAQAPNHLCDYLELDFP